MNVFGGRSRARVATATLSLVAVLALSGCGDKDEDQLSAGGGSTAPTAPDTTATAPNATPSVTTPPDPSQEPTAAPDDPADDVTGAAACLPGTWVLDNTAYARWVGLDDGDVTGTVEGTLTMTYRDDGTVDTNYDSWSFSAGTNSLGMTITLTRDGTDHGTYTVAADGSAALTDTEIDSTSLWLGPRVGVQ